MENENIQRSMLSLCRLLPTLALLLAGCAALPTPFVPEKDTSSFHGMSALFDDAPGRPLHVLLIHGMGTPQPYGFDAFIATLAGRFGYVQRPPPKPEAQYQGCYKGVTAAEPALATPPPDVIDIPDAAPENQARLYTYDFAPPGSDKAALTVSYLLWTPLTESVKCRLEDEDASAPQKHSFADFAKDFIDDKLADALLYGGTYRQRVVRPSLQGALCKVTGGTWTGGKCDQHAADYRDPIVIITHSLGGYMIMDAIQDELRGRCEVNGDRVAATRTPAEKVLENTPVIYMMANQLALLDLSTLRRDPNAPRRARDIAGEKITNDFARCWAAARARSAAREGRTAPVSQVVAFSDPNDILSWRLEPRNLQFPQADWGKVAVTNVFMSNGEFSTPGLFSDPVNAHTGYFVNPTVMDMLICGMKDGVVQSCPTRAAAL
jgi:hypothetical protein